MSEEREMALLLLRLGSEDGGRVNAQRCLSRPHSSDARKAFLYCQHEGWVDSYGYITAVGSEVLEQSS